MHNIRLIHHHHSPTTAATVEWSLLSKLSDLSGGYEFVWLTGVWGEPPATRLVVPSTGTRQGAQFKPSFVLTTGLTFLTFSPTPEIRQTVVRAYIGVQEVVCEFLSVHVSFSLSFFHSHTHRGKEQWQHCMSTTASTHVCTRRQEERYNNQKDQRLTRDGTEWEAYNNFYHISKYF